MNRRLTHPAFPLLVLVLVLAALPAFAQTEDDLEFLLFEGELLLEEGQLAEALTLTRRALELAPDRIEAHLLHARALTASVLSGRTPDVPRFVDEALEHYRWVLERNPNHPEAVRGVQLLATFTTESPVPPLETDQARDAWDAGMTAMEREDFDSAADAFRRGLEAEPDQAVLQTALGEALRLKEDPVGARRAFAKAIDLDPEAVEAHGGLGEVAETEGDTEEALEHYRAALALFAGYRPAQAGIVRLLGEADPATLSVGDLTLLGDAFLAVDRYERAETAYTRALEKDDESPEARRGLGIIAFFDGRDGTCLELLEPYLEDHPDDLEVAYYLAALHLRRGERGPGEAYLREILRQDPSDPNALRLLGLSVAEDPEGAEEALELLLRADRYGASIPNLACIVGNLYMRVERFREAAFAFEDCVARYPDDAGAQFGLGVLADDQGQTRAAIDHLQRYLELAGDDPEMSAVFRLGVAFLRTGQDEPGFETLRRVVERNVEEAGADPDTTTVTDRQLLEMTSFFLASARRYEDAIFIGEMLLTLDTENAIYNNNLAMTYADAGQNLGRAHSLAIKANKLDPRNPGHMDTLAWTLIRLDRLDEAEDTLIDAINLAGDQGPSNLSEVYYHLGVLYYKQKKLDDAETFLVRALEDPPTPFLREEIERLLDTTRNEQP